MKTLNAPKKIIYPYALIPIFVWIGFICSISFMEAWLKFRAPNVTLPIGLSIGKLIFAALNKAEWVLATLTAILMFVNHRRWKCAKSFFFFIPVSILMIQSLYLLPSLSKRAEIISQGLTAAPTSVHFFYIFFELFKVLSLLTLGTLLIFDLANKESPAETV